jgi:hypothetical protein
LELTFNDFDGNGTPEQFLSRFANNKMLPYTLRGDLVSNIPILKKKYLKFKNYGNQGLTDIFTPEQMRGAITSTAAYLGNAVLLSKPDGTYQLVQLPNEAQFAPLYGLCTGDFDKDGFADIVAGGNFLGSKPEFGYIDADYGIFLKGDGKGGFTVQHSAQTGLFFEGEVRDIRLLKTAGSTTFAVARNNMPLEFWKIK